MKNRILVLLLLLTLSFFSNNVFAEGTQTIKGIINDSFNIDLNQSFPIDTSIYNEFSLLNPLNVGVMKVNYEFLGAYDAKGKISSVDITGDTEVVHLTNNGSKEVIANFKVPVAFDTPVFVGFNLTVFTDDFFFKFPTLEMIYPQSLNLISTSPISLPSNPIKLNYPNSKYAGLMSLNFIKTSLPNGYNDINVGIFTIVGTPTEVKKITKAVEDFGFLKEMYTRMTGDFGLPRIWVFTEDLTNKGSLYKDSGGYSRMPNVILLNKNNIETISKVDLQEVLIHEITHLVVFGKIFNKEEKKTPWFDEGIAVFFQLYSADNYFDKLGYWIGKDSQGNNAVIQSNSDRFSTETLRERYTGEFYFNLDNPAYVNDMYAHAGLVLYNFYLLTGDVGLKKLFEELTPLESSGTDCLDCDTQKILTIMETISGKTENELLFPYKGDPNFDAKVAPLVKKSFSQDEIDTILKQLNTDTNGGISNNDSTNNSVTEEQFPLATIALIGIILVVIGAIVFFVLKGKKKN